MVCALEQSALTFEEGRVADGLAVGEQGLPFIECRSRRVYWRGKSLALEAVASSVVVPCGDRCSAFGGGEALEERLPLEASGDVLVGRDAAKPRAVVIELVEAGAGTTLGEPGLQR
jgi:hypothetical protein